jgi:predicted DNA-binding antitoxin AbrB/MazE fold protein
MRAADKIEDGQRAAAMIRAKCEYGVFKPLDDVKLAEGTLVKISVPVEASPKRRKSVRDLPAFGMWADRDDIRDGVSYEDALRNRRRQ